MKYKNIKLGLSIELDEALVDRIKDAGLQHYPKEFGGVLVGRYSLDRTCVFVSDMILPIKYASTRCTFDRGNEGLKEKLEDFFAQDPSKIYVGEWHTHPNGAPIPSGTDISALRQIVTARNVHIDSPVMLIVGINKGKFDLAMYVYFKNKIYNYENT